MADIALVKGVVNEFTDTQHTPNASSAVVTFTGTIVLNSQSDNKSNVTITYKLYTGKYIAWDNTTDSSGKIEIKVGSQTAYTPTGASGNVPKASKDKTYAIIGSGAGTTEGSGSWTGDIPHNADGTLSNVTISWIWKKGSSAYQPYDSTISKTFSFPTLFGPPTLSSNKYSVGKFNGTTNAFKLTVTQTVVSSGYVMELKDDRSGIIWGDGGTAIDGYPDCNTKSRSVTLNTSSTASSGNPKYTTEGAVKFTLKVYKKGTSGAPSGSAVYTISITVYILGDAFPISLYHNGNKAGVSIGREYNETSWSDGGFYVNGFGPFEVKETTLTIDGTSGTYYVLVKKV